MKKLKLILQCISLLVLLQSTLLAWDPPIGIPRPSFGIEETYRMYDDPANRNPALTYHQNAEGGYFTHYIDNTDTNATNTNNPYGTLSKPRLTVPGTDLPAGSVVEIHGGPYTTTTYGGNWTYFTGNGTAAMPIFIRGATGEMPVHRDITIRMGLTYNIIENLDIDPGRIWLHKDKPAEYIGIRNIEIHNSVGIGTAIWAEAGHYITIYNNYVHHLGNYNFVPWEEDDQMAVAAGRDPASDRSARYLWIVDNHMESIAGDCVQLNSGTEELDDVVRYVYIGRNIMSGPGENAVDLKQSADVIISQNSMYGFGQSPGSDGTAMVVNDDFPHENIWIINNDIYDSVDAIRAQDSCYIIGNVLHDLHHVTEPWNPDGFWEDGGYAIHSWGVDSLAIVGNTIYRVDSGISYPGGAVTAKLYIENNIIANLNTSSHHIGIHGTQIAANSSMRHNVLFQSGGSAKIRWGDYTVETLTQFQQRTGKGAGCLETDPLLVNAENNDFHLQSASPAIDKGILSDVYQTFFDLYGIDIRKDIEGGVRPYGAEWDIGAYEWGSTPADPNSEPEPDIDTEPAVEPETLIPDVTALVVMNNIIKAGENQSALIRCDIKDASKLTVKIYDAKGREIITVCDEQREAGRHEFVWAGRDSSGNTVGSGIYIVHLKSGGYSETKKIAIIK